MGKEKLPSSSDSATQRGWPRSVATTTGSGGGVVGSTQSNWTERIQWTRCMH